MKEGKERFKYELITERFHTESREADKQSRKKEEATKGGRKERRRLLPSWAFRPKTCSGSQTFMLFPSVLKVPETQVIKFIKMN